MSMFDNAREQAEKYMNDNPDKVEQLSDQGIQKAGDVAEGLGIDADKVAQGEQFLDDKIGDAGGAEEQQA